MTNNPAGAPKLLTKEEWRTSDMELAETIAMANQTIANLRAEIAKLEQDKATLKQSVSRVIRLNGWQTLKDLNTTELRPGTAVGRRTRAGWISVGYNSGGSVQEVLVAGWTHYTYPPDEEHNYEDQIVQVDTAIAALTGITDAKSRIMKDLNYLRASLVNRLEQFERQQAVSTT